MKTNSSFYFPFSFLSTVSSLPCVPAKAAAKKGKGKAVISVSTSFNPLDQTCIHPESYHVAQRYRTHKCNMYFQKSSGSPRDPHLPVFVIFTCNGFYAYIQYIWLLGAALGKIGWGAYSPHVKKICPYPPDPSMFELRWGFDTLSHGAGYTEVRTLTCLAQTWDIKSVCVFFLTLWMWFSFPSLLESEAWDFISAVFLCVHAMCVYERGGPLSYSCSHSTLFSLHKFWQ